MGYDAGYQTIGYDEGYQTIGYDAGYQTIGYGASLSDNWAMMRAIVILQPTV
ncbi:MAG: hypothetical protein RBS43_01335 [Candidatus Cloacimonas sp.]|jgi:GH24 family phage-related lysozyme (muramidase)|nr:hypothetical protein [Candidatus Cloacimonas sp.]